MPEHSPGEAGNPAVQMQNMPVLNVTGWAILDFELALDGLRQVGEATCWLQNQPRASRSDHAYHPGAEFIVELGEDWCANIKETLLRHLEVVRFPDPKHEERRILLLLQDATRWGSASEPLADILAMAAKQMESAG